MSDTPAPTLRPEAHYIKDLSFESPQGLQPLIESGGKLPFPQMRLDVATRKVGDDQFEVLLSLRLLCATGKEGDTSAAWICEMAYGGIFTIKNIPQNQMQFVLLVECPRLLFPYTRACLANILSASGWPTLNLPLVDFLELYTHHQEREKTPMASGAVN